MENPNPENAESTSKTRKRKRILNLQNSRWKNPKNQSSYSSKLLEALSRVRLSNPAPKGRTVREAADRALAIAARGRSRWSRAILSRRSLGIKCRRRNPDKSDPPKLPVKRTASDSGSGSGVLEQKARVLGRLVPGCRKLEFPKLLEETTDYIMALEMQVRAMGALVQILSGLDSGPNRSRSD